MKGSDNLRTILARCSVIASVAVALTVCRSAVAGTTYHQKRGQVESIEAFAESGTARLLTLEINELKPIWKKQ